MGSDAHVEDGWRRALADEFAAPYMARIRRFLVAEEQAGSVVYPPPADIFRAFNLTPFADVRVVIVGQDPYHGPGQAHGLSFSVPTGVRIPPSLANIFREIQQDIGSEPPSDGNLDGWATQGVLLLNATLTVRAGAAGSHHGAGWEEFTTAALRAVNAHHEGVVFLLWGRHAQRLGRVIDHSRHHVLTAPHPSPLSAHTGFFGCGHFSHANKILVEQGKTPIDWVKRVGMVQSSPAVG